MSKFNLSRPWKVFYGFMCLSSIFLAYGYLRHYSEWLRIVGSIFWVYLAGSYFFHLFDYLVIDEDGFQYHALGIHYSGKWSDVEGIANQRHIIPLLESICQGAYIPTAKLTLGKSWLTSKDLFVPLSIFIPNWRESVQKQKINTYIAHSQSKSIDA